MIKCKICKICKQKITGRSNKIFCSSSCKSYYHRELRKVTNLEAIHIDEILHRNRSILLEIMGKNRIKIKIKRTVLERKKFRFKYHTHFHINKAGKMYKHVYDFAWMEFSDDTVLIVRRRH